VIAEPPLLLGAIHDTTRDELVAPEALTLVGAPGATARVDTGVDTSENSPVFEEFTAAIWNS
jgi:hypothetical protein